MRKTIITLSLILWGGLYVKAQERKDILIPQIVLSNGTFIQVTYQKESKEITVFVTDNPEEIVVFVIDKDGNIVDIDSSFFNTDSLTVKADDDTDVYVATKEEEEHIASSEE